MVNPAENLERQFSSSAFVLLWRQRLTSSERINFHREWKVPLMASFGLKSVDDRVYFRANRKQTLFLVFLCLCLLLIAFLLVALLVLLLIAHQSSNQQEISTEVLRSSIFSNIRPERISDNLRAFTKKPHQSGTEANKEVADEIEQRWKANGLEDVHQMSYDVLLTYPKWDRPNHVYVVAQDGRVLFNSSGLSPDLIGDDNTPEASIQWLAYSADGTAQGEPVYCNHGTVEDFDRLEQEFKINMKGKIAIMRYGGTFRGDMVYHAYKRGAVGAILYSDPFEAAPDGPDHVFPSATWMPPQGVQRGSTMKFHGDPLSPLLPSRKDFHKERSIDETVTDPETMPQIPVQPLSYADAYQILSRMDGPVVPSGWQGGMNVTYRLGPGFRSGQGQRVRVEVHAKFEVRTIQNVIGYIWGSEHPDEWVLLGNHYDAWVFGSLDPNSGTSILAEVAKGLAETVKSTGWRPKRTIVFCAWDAEEYGLMGSIEFVEEFANILTERAVVYLNLDLISANNSLKVNTVPSLYNVAVEAAKVVKHPTKQNEKRTMFDAWIEHFPSRTDWMSDFPQMNVPGGGSDHMSFLNFLGIPVMDLTYIDPSLPGHQYPLYHSRYESPIVNEQLFDQNLTVHKAVGEYWAELGRLFADSPLLPISATTFAHKMVFEYVEDAKGPILDLHSRFPNVTKVAKDQLDKLARNANQFLAQAEEFERRMGVIGTDRANARLRKLEQCFINPTMGLAREEPAKRHVLFSVSSEDFYAGTTMSAVHKKIRQLVAALTDAERLQRSNELALEITVVQQAVLCAVNTLRSAV